MTAEVAFTKTFLQVLDSKPIKLQSDYAIDARTLEITFPYTLPGNQNAKPMTRPSATGSSSSDPSSSTTTSAAGASSSAPGSEPALSVSLKSTKNPPLDLNLPAEALSTSVLDLKQRVAKEIGLESVDKIRLLYNKKPVGDAKTLKEILGDEKGKKIEFGVMVIGYSAPAAVGSGSGVKDGEGDTVMQNAAPVAQGESGVEVLRNEGFWSDLQGFLEQRVRDQAVAEKATKVFREAWKASGTS